MLTIVKAKEICHVIFQWMHSCTDNYIYLITTTVAKDTLPWCSSSVTAWLSVIDRRIPLGLWVRNSNAIFISRPTEYLLAVQI